MSGAFAIWPSMSSGPFREGDKPLVATDAEKPQVIPFATIRDALDTLVAALTNLLDREFPKEFMSIPGLQPFLLVAMNAARNTYEAIRYLAADLPKDPSRKVEFGLAIAPLARSLADLLFTLVFMREDLPSHVPRYHRGGWRELKEDFDRHRSEYGSLPEWQSWLKGYETALEQSRLTYGISKAESDNPRVLPYWPTPGQMLKHGELSDESNRFLQYLNDWVYRGLSAATHMSGAGIVRRHGVLLLTKDQGREEIVAKLKSDGVFTTITLMVAICTEMNDMCRYGRDQTLSYLWGILIEYWGEAKDLFERRYNGMLATR